MAGPWALPRSSDERPPPLLQCCCRHGNRQTNQAEGKISPCRGLESVGRLRWPQGSFTQSFGVLSELEMNLKFNKALGIAMPESCLLRAE
jgi:hypothetical protein